VAAQGARGVLVFDGQGANERRGPLEVRWAKDADTLLERLAAEQRGRERVLLVTSDATVAAAAGGAVAKLTSQTFFRELSPPQRREEPPAGLAGKLDEETRSRLERLRRGE
jgi:predicted RNA-binding protein with PIN domain